MALYEYTRKINRSGSVVETFRKGQIVPRRLNLIDVDKQKKRHLWVFGGAVEVDGRSVKLIDGKCVFLLKRPYIDVRKNGPKEYVKSYIDALNFFIAEDCGNENEIKSGFLIEVES